MYKLIENEILKMIKNKKIYITTGILFIIVLAFAYEQYHSLNRTKNQLTKRIGITTANDWRNIVQQQLIDMKSRLNSPYLNKNRRTSTQIRIKQLQHNIDNNINPIDITKTSFTTRFITQSISLFLPLLIILLSADLVSRELNSGTIKMLLVQKIPR